MSFILVFVFKARTPPLFTANKKKVTDLVIFVAISHNLHDDMFLKM